MYVADAVQWVQPSQSRSHMAQFARPRSPGSEPLKNEYSEAAGLLGKIVARLRATV
jgi:hypothetical protein